MSTDVSLLSVPTHELTVSDLSFLILQLKVHLHSAITTQVTSQLPVMLHTLSSPFNADT